MPGHADQCPGSAPSATFNKMSDSSAGNRSIEELVEEQNVKLASLLDSWCFKQEEVMARMSNQQQQLDETIAIFGAEVSRFAAVPAAPAKNKRISAMRLAAKGLDSAPTAAENQDKLAVVAGTAEAVQKPARQRGSMLKQQSPPRDSCNSNSEGWKDTESDRTRGSAMKESQPSTDIAAQYLHYKARLKTCSALSLEELMSHRSHKSNEPILQEIVKSGKFDGICALMILANAGLISAETELMSRPDVDGYNDTFFILQLALNCWFTVELMLRLGAEGPVQFLTGSGWRWNLFDSLLLVTAIVDIVMTTTVLSDYGANDEGVSVSGGSLKVIRLMRVVRSLRLVRALKYIREFRKMIYALQASMQTVVWSLLLLFCFMYCFAILFTQAACEFWDRLPDDERELERNIDVKDSYGNLSRSFCSLYLAISDGKSWGQCMDPLMEIDPFFAVLFLVFVSITLFGVTNVITAVFVESAMSSAQYYKDLIIEDTLRNKEIACQHMRQVFKFIDEDGSGVIDANEFEEFLKDPALQVYLESLEISAEDTRLLFRLLDKDDSGEIDIEEFCNGCLRLKGDAKSFDIHVLMSQVTKSINLIEKSSMQVQQRVEDLLPKMVELADEQGAMLPKVLDAIYEATNLPKNVVSDAEWGSVVEKGSAVV